MKLSLLIALSLITPQLFANSKVIYGIDNRIDLFETDTGSIPKKFPVPIDGSSILPALNPIA